MKGSECICLYKFFFVLFCDKAHEKNDNMHSNYVHTNIQSLQNVCEKWELHAYILHPTYRNQFDCILLCV